METYLIILLGLFIILSISSLIYYYRFRKEKKSRQYIITFRLPVPNGTVIKVFNNGIDNTKEPNKLLAVKIIKKLDEERYLVEKPKGVE